MKGFYLSLRYKFLLVMAVLLATAIVSYLSLAVMLFNNDKSAYVYEINHTLTDNVATRSGVFFRSSLVSLRSVARILADTNEELKDRRSRAAAVIEQDAALIEVSFLRETDGTVETIASIHDSEFLSRHQFPGTFWRDERVSAPVPVDGLSPGSTMFHNATRPGGPSVIRFAARMEKEPEYIITAHFHSARLDELFSRQTDFEMYLTDAWGGILAYSRGDLEGPVQQHLSESKYLKGQQMSSGSFEYTDKTGREYIASFRKLFNDQLVAFSKIPKERAFLASRQLVEKSALFAVLIILVSFIVSVLFTRRLTAALATLYQATKRIAAGDFSHRVEIRASDEVGALSTSFNLMSERITVLMAETADKARMEKELETAHIVQENFFPVDEVRHGDYGIAASFAPASECGGDWWGHFIVGNQLIVLMGDATGHGVPSALMTAAAHACITTVASLSAENQLQVSASILMRHLNHAIYHAGRGKINMTFFTMVISMDSGEISYCNAAHEIPYICRMPEGEPFEAEREGGDMDIFDGEPVNILGRSLDMEFPEHTQNLEPGDSLVVYTDGLTEGRNPDGEEYGESRLEDSLIRNGNQPPEILRDRILADANTFYNGCPADDDLTMVVVHRVPAQGKLDKAG